MKNILYTIILSFLFSSSVFADFEAGMDAYEIGHYKTAYKEFRSAAEQGDPAAQFQLGQMYSGGEGVTRDYQEEVKWYRLSAEQGYPKAMFMLAWNYKFGLGVAQDYKKTIEWFRLAGEHGNAQAMYNIGNMYDYGDGVVKDNKEAKKWYQIGDCIKKNYGRGYKYVQEFLVDNTEFPKVVRKLKLISPKILTKAKRIGHECAKKNYEDHG